MPGGLCYGARPAGEPPESTSVLHPLQKFRHYEIAEDPKGASLELWRTEREVVCLASEPSRRQFVELHVVTTADATNEPVTTAFRERAQKLLRINHPHVAELRECGVDDGTLFWTCALVDGEPLDSYLARCNPLPAWLAVELARQVVAGLTAVKHEPLLLAGVDLFNARLALHGELTADAAVRLVDFDLAAAPGPPPDPREAERQAVRQVGRLMLYALSGLVSEKLTSRTLANLPVPVELGQVLTRLLDPAARPQLTSLETLGRALEGCQKNLTLATRPDRLPQTLRPRLPLQAHFSSLAQLAEETGAGWRLERTPFDAAQPYAQRAFGAASKPVMLQLMPPVRLMAAEWLPAVRLAAERVKEDAHPRLIRILQMPVGDEPTWFMEDAQFRLTLEGVVRLRKGLSAGEAAFLMREVDRAVAEAEKVGLPATILCPQQVFVDFSGGGAAPADDDLAGTPVDQWPAFVLRVRTHPVATQFAQAHRFQREPLVGRGPRVRATEGVAGLRAPVAADYAALFQWLCGGEAGLPGELAALVPRTIDGSGEPDRRKFMELLAAHVPKPVKRTAKATPKPAAEPTAPAKVKLSKRESARASSTAPAPKHAEPAKPAAKSAKKATRAGAKTSGAATKPPAPAPAEATPPSESPGAFGALTAAPRPDEAAEDEEDAGGFAEILFGARPAPEPDGAEDAFPAIGGSAAPRHGSPDAVDDDAEPLPMGAFLGNLTRDEPVDADFPTLDFDPRDSGSGGLPVKLIFLVIVTALVIAIVGAHVTGLAPWVQGR